MTRIARGTMNQIKSLRIDLKQFKLTSENRRILRKVDGLKLNSIKLPISKQDYDWRIHKMGKNFYTTKFGDNTFSANKIKELLTNEHNYNLLFSYSKENLNKEKLGYAICLQTNLIVHYCYPFYRLDIDTNNLGMGMMLKAILWAKENEKNYMYLGSDQKYKQQFKGLQVWEKALRKWRRVDN
ncbi:hypothetical protein GF362_00485 [Candidatus Dojkabacteria bacterium]|nr:hypothetical protein [Candidatus Dojkabacteria bacterium]